jgi:NAD(P)-dependent dehydrogenase (short-subunit alcohol dehydrogenase family)
VAIVTGASRGIGKAIAQMFAEEGAKVVCVARTVNEGDSRAPGSLTGTVEAIRAAGGEAIMVAANLSEEADCDRIVAEAHAAFGPVDVLVNNAVTNFPHAVADFPSKRWMLGFAVNIHAPFLLSRAVIPDMRAKGRGAIVNISSGVAIGPGRGPYEEPGWNGMGVLYGATKAALERFTQGLAQEEYANGIQVTCLSPSQAVFTEGALLFNKPPQDMPNEPASTMARAALLLATEPIDRVTGRVCYSQQILKEFDWIAEAHGQGVDSPGSGYAQL